MAGKSGSLATGDSARATSRANTVQFAARFHARMIGVRRCADMPRTSPWHSDKEGHHHDNTKCEAGSRILPHNRIPGTGGKPLCMICAQLDFGTPENRGTR
jgi:hypothetical protein